MREYFLESEKDYRLMSQTGVRQYCYPPDSTHNAIWDSNVSPEGKLYFALASEICTSEYVRLCEYDYERNDVKELFNVRDVILPSERAIRASKFHSSICFMPDGRLIMTTHTTDKSPAHPTWMPEAYYHHIWEGFAGSHIIVYDPASGEAKNLGMPVPRESIYGSVYDPKHNALFSLGLFRGHIYRYDLSKKTVIDLGRVSERYSFRLVLGPDGNIYGASKTGYVYKVDTETLKITDMNYRLPHYDQLYRRDFTNISIGRIGPDGRLYFAVMYGRSIIALDTDSGKFEDMGEYLDAAHYAKGENRNGIFGMDFDSKGVLWYVVSSRNDGSEHLEYGLPASLFRWDITRGKRPEWAGLCGTKKRVGSWVSEVCISKDDILYAVGSNHGMDGPDITAVDLKVFEPTMNELGGNTEDRYYLKDDPHYRKVAMRFKELEDISAANPYTFRNRLYSPAVALWRELAPDHIDDSAVKGVYWEDDRVLTGLCGGPGGTYMFRITDGRLTELTDAKTAGADVIAEIKKRIAPLQAPCGEHPLPFYPGRQYKAQPSASVALSGGRTAVGTQDGMLAIIGENGVFSLGPAVYNGPVRFLSATPDGCALYGVGGDVEDLGVLFYYGDGCGLKWLGHIEMDSSEHGSFFIPLISCCAVSPDGKKLAVCSGDRLGTVVIYEL